jgi:uncharacterized damage-inducible protein DinB
MVYHSVTEIYEEAQDVRQQICQRVENLGPAQANFKTAPETWSVAEVLEHLNKVELFYAKVLGSLLPQATSPVNGKTAPVKFVPFSMDSYIEGTRERKLKSPEA